MKTTILAGLGRAILGAGFFLSALACSGGGTSALIPAAGQSSGSNATVSDSGAGIQIPDGSFDKSVEVTLDGSSGVSLADIGNAEAISSPTTVTFTKVQSITGDAPITLTIPFDKQALQRAFDSGKGVYAKVKIEGKNLSDDVGTGDPTWIPVIGSLDMDAGIMTVRLMASADTVHAVAVVGKELKVVASDSPSAGASKRVSRSKIGRNVLTSLGQHSWAVLCENDRLSDNGEGSCNTSGYDPDHSGNLSPVLELQKELNTYSAKLSAQGLNSALVAQMTVQDIIDSHNESTPTKAQLQAMPDKTALFNVAYFTNANQRCNNTDEHADVIGCYYHSNGTLVFGEQYDDPPVKEVAGDVVAHELTHAVQAAMCRGCSSANGAARPNKGFIEGTADFVGNYFYVNENSSQVQQRSLENEPRKWTVPLGVASADLEPYKTFEFYALASNGRISTLPGMFRGFASGNGQGFGHGLESAMQAGLGISAKEAFIKAVALRNFRSINKKHYSGFNGTPDWRSYNSAVKAFAADHYTASAPFSDSNCFSKIQLTGPGSDDLAAIVVTNIIYAGATTIDLGDGTFANFVTGNDAMMMGREGGGQCGLDVIVANINLESAPDAMKPYSLLVGFD